MPCWGGFHERCPQVAPLVAYQEARTGRSIQGPLKSQGMLKDFEVPYQCHAWRFLVKVWTLDFTGVYNELIFQDCLHVKE